MLWSLLLQLHMKRFTGMESLHLHVWKLATTHPGFFKEFVGVFFPNLERSTAYYCQREQFRLVCWYHRRNITLCKAIVQQIAELILFLHQELKLTVPAVKAVDQPGVFSGMFSSFRKSWLPGQVKPPEWKLYMVLRASLVRDVSPWNCPRISIWHGNQPYLWVRYQWGRQHGWAKSLLGMKDEVLLSSWEETGQPSKY